MVKASITLTLTPTELDVIRQSLFAYLQALELAPGLAVGNIPKMVRERYGTDLADILPTELKVAVRKVINSLR